MNVKVVREKDKVAVALYECDAVKLEKPGPDTLVTLVRIHVDKAYTIAQIVLPRDGDTVYVENSSGGTIDTFRAGEELPTGRPIEIREGSGDAQPEEDRTRVFRGLPRGTGPGTTLDVQGVEAGKASVPVARPPAR